MANMHGRISNYRITAASITCELIAPALSDQGTITAAQYTLPPRTVNPSFLDKGQNPNVEETFCDNYIYPEPAAPSAALLGTSAYTAKAREGVYMPLKLSSFKWKDMNDPVILHSASLSALSSNNIGIAPATPLTFPYFEDRSGRSLFGLPAHPKLTSDIFAIAHFEGMAANVSIRVRVRQVVEINAPPGTTYAPLLEVALPPDKVALEMYQEISARMADGYPASYNDLGILKNIVTKIGKTLLPHVEPALDIVSKMAIPGVSTVATVGKKLLSAGKAIAPVVKAAAGKKANVQPSTAKK
jgi:hypothetical protein